MATVHTAAQSAAQKRLGRLPFSQQANYSAVLELDGFGWQASLLSKLGLGSAVITQASLYPLWFDTLLQSGVHVLRARPDLSDLAPLLRTATGPAGAQIAVAGRQRLCQLMHLPHLARFVRTVLGGYA